MYSAVFPLAEYKWVLSVRHFRNLLPLRIMHVLASISTSTSKLNPITTLSPTELGGLGQKRPWPKRVLIRSWLPGLITFFTSGTSPPGPGAPTPTSPPLPPRPLHIHSGFDGLGYYMPQYLVLTNEMAYPVIVARGMDAAAGAFTTLLPLTRVFAYDDSMVDNMDAHPVRVCV